MRTRLTILSTAIALLFASTGLAGTIDWKGVTWTIDLAPDGNVVTNADGSITLTADADGDCEIYVTTLPGFDQMSNAWMEVSYWDTNAYPQYHNVDLFTYSPDYRNPSIQAGSLWWSTKVGSTVIYTNTPPGGASANREQQYVIWSGGPAPAGWDRTNVQHTLYVEKHRDGVVDFQIDSDPTVSSSHLVPWVGGGWNLGITHLRLRYATPGASATFTDFRYLEVATWTGGSGDWTNGANWDTGTVPGEGTAVIVPSGAGTITLNTSTSNLWSYTQNGGTLHFVDWNCKLEATTVTMNGGTMDHALCDTNAVPGNTNRVYIEAVDVTIGGSAEINVNARGYPGAPNVNLYGQGPGGAYGNSGDQGGGGHGGAGATMGGVSGGPENGVASAPENPGSGGGADGTGSKVGGNGGGAVRIAATGRVTVDGTITANATPYRNAGGGAGGSIWISSDTYTGTGLLTATGGNGSAYRGGGGGGGRIAVTYDVDSQAAAGLSPSVQYSVARGTGSSGVAVEARAGTLYLPDDQIFPTEFSGGARVSLASDPATVQVTNLTVTGGLLEITDFAEFISDGDLTLTDGGCGAGVKFTRVPTITVSNDIMVSNAGLEVISVTNVPAVLTCGGDLTVTGSGCLRATGGNTNATYPKYGAWVDVTGDMLVTNGSSVYAGILVPVNTNGDAGAVLFTMDNLVVSSDSDFNADGAGYAGGNATDHFHGYGPGGGHSGSGKAGGGGYGGSGGYPSGAHGSPYGSATNANSHGSGGAMSPDSRRWSQGVGVGGGVIWVQAAGDVTMDGTLSADSPSLNTYNGGGAGGGILVQAGGDFSGASGAAMSATGGSCNPYNDGGGAGGRIAIWRNVPDALRDRIAAGTASEDEYSVSESPFDEFAGDVDVAGGTASASGASGTIRFLEGPAPPVVADFSTWGKSMEITFDGYPVGRSELAGFPALVKLTAGSNGVDFGDFQAGGADLRFTAADQSTELKYEIETWDDTDSNSWVWVRVPELTNGTTVYAYWGNATSSVPAYTTNGATWDSDFTFVHHLQETNSGGASGAEVYEDSTGNGWHGDDYVSATGQDGKIAGGQAFDGSDDGIDCGDIEVDAWTEISISAWFKTSTDSGSQRLLSKDQVGVQGCFILWRQGAADTFQVYDGAPWAAAQSSRASDGEWHHMAGTVDQTDDKVYLYVDGQQVASDDFSPADFDDGDNEEFVIGADSDVGAFDHVFDGSIDEVRVSDVARSADWIWACYMNAASNGQFMTHADAVLLGSGGPSIQTLAATNVTTTGACLNGYLSSTGMSVTTAFVYWGETDGETNVTQWAHTNTFTAPQSVGPLSTNVTVSLNTLYYYRFMASNSARTAWSPASESLVSGEVSVLAADSNASEKNDDTGLFAFQRPASTTGQPLVVRFTLSGTATEGEDYEPLGTSVTIPAGDTNGYVTVTPIFDLTPEGTETVRVTLAAGPYAIGGAMTADIAIGDALSFTNSEINVWNATGNWNTPGGWSLGRIPADGDHVILSNSVTLSESTPVLASLTQDAGTFTFSGWSTALRAADVVMNTGKMDHALCDTNAVPGNTNRVHIIATDVTIGSNAQINVHARGFPGGPTGNTYGQGPGGAYGAAGGTAGGGGHGGAGGSSYGGVVNDAVASPVYPGSGGGSRGNDPGETGGGSVRIVAADRVTINGTIRASGGGGGAYNGGGAGGSIWISCDTFTGEGLLNADGGTGHTYNGGGGGGGRIAVTYDPGNQTASGLTPTVQFSINGGTGKYRGGAGTLYLLDAQFLPSSWPGGAVISFDPGVTSVTRNYADMHFANGPVTYPDIPVSFSVVGNVVLVGAASPDGAVFGSGTSLHIGGDLVVTNAQLTLGTNLAVSGAVRLDNAATLSLLSHSNGPAIATCGSDFTMTASSKLYVYAADTNASFPEYGARVDIGEDMTLSESSWVYPDVRDSINSNNTLGAVLFMMNNLTVSSNSGFNAGSRGYAGARTDYSWTGLGPGGGKQNNNPSGGGGYGGAGAAADATYGKAYGSATNSNHHGSGGGIGESRGHASPAGAGGGVIWIQADGDVTMDGTLSANGQSTATGMGNSKYNGGGSGGGILVQAAGDFSGAAGSVLSSKGGDSYSYDGGGGGGGRIAIWCNMPDALRDRIAAGTADETEYVVSEIPFEEFTGDTYLTGGSGKASGSPGTVRFLEAAPPPGGTVILIR